MIEENHFADEQKTIVSSEAGVAETTKESPKETITKLGPDVSALQEEEIARMEADPRYHLIAVPGTGSAVINITEAKKSGVDFYRMKDNRIHGRDESKTGTSIMNNGAQIPLSVFSTKVAKAAGVEFERFANDPDKDKPISDGFVVADGHGRTNFLLGQNIEDWPTVLGVFPMPDKDGEIHVVSAFIEINKNDTVWKSDDYIHIRLSDPTSHPAWRYIKDLERKGLSFTVATIFITGKEGTINKRTVLDSKADLEELFKYHKAGMKIFKSCEESFNTEKGSAILTKQLPNKIFSIWSDLKDNTSMTADQAADYVAAFILDLKAKDSRAAEINAAKKVGDKDRDTVRKELLSKYFDEYRTTHPIV